MNKRNDPDVTNRRSSGVVLTSLTKAAGYYTAVDFTTKAMQAASVLLLANIFSKPEFGSFSILYAVMQLFSAIVLGGVVEFAIPLLASKKDKNGVAIDVVMQKAFSVVAARLIYLIPVTIATLVFLYLIEYRINTILNSSWLAVCLIAGILSGVVNVYIGILTCDGQHRKSIIFRANIIAAQSIFGLAGAWFFHEINYYFISLVLVPVIIGYKSILKLSWGLIFKIKFHMTEAFSYFFFNSLINWIPWYGLTLAVGLLLDKGAAAEYALIMNMASVMLLAAGGFSQAFISVQINASGLISKKIIGKIIALQTMLLATCAALLFIFYTVLLNIGLIGHEYGNLQIRLIISLIAIVFSSAYFVTVPAYSLRRRGLVLVYISLSAVALAIIAGWTCYQVTAEYFPYATFCTFFILRAWLVSAKSGYSWKGAFSDNRRMLSLTIIAVAGIIFFMLLMS